LKRKALIKAALSRHGLSSASDAKKKRMLAAAEAEADEALAFAGKRQKLSEAQVAPDDLTGGSSVCHVRVFAAGHGGGAQGQGGCTAQSTACQQAELCPILNKVKKKQF
jgi:hypothetical protein